jgi:hypothetical protein
VPAPAAPRAPTPAGGAAAPGPPPPPPPAWRSGLEKELAALIASQQIKARIDSHAKVNPCRFPQLE